MDQNKLPEILNQLGVKAVATPLDIASVTEGLDADGGGAGTDAGLPWEQFVAQPMDSAMFIKLLAVCDFRVAEATVLWDLLEFHRTQGLEEFAVRSGIDYDQKFSAGVTARSYQRAIKSLDEQSLIETTFVVRNVAKKFRLNWGVLWTALSQVSPKIPGLGGSEAV